MAMRVNVLKLEERDVLVVDSKGSENIVRCIPSGCKYFILPILEKIVVPINLRFYYYVFYWIVAKRRIKLLGILPYISVIKPKVVITNIDNSGFFNEASVCFDGVDFIAVQNGLRTSSLAISSGWLRSKSLPIYFGFGDYERDLMLRMGVSVQKYIPAGSLRLGLYLSEQESLGNYCHNSICFVSQYRQVDSNSGSMQIHNLRMSRMVSEFISRFCVEMGLKVRVALAGSISYRDNAQMRNGNPEVVFYKGIIDDGVCEYVSRHDRFGSYKTCFMSDVVISIDSTLAFEMFGAGKKVLFFGLSDEKWTKMRETEMLFSNVPPELLLYDCEYNSFRDKLMSLINMSMDDYRDLTKGSRNYCMRLDKPYAHDMIIEHISLKVNS